MLCREGPSSGTPRWGYPSHRYRGGPHSAHEPRTATPLRRPQPASHIQMIVTNDESFPWLTTLIRHWQKQINAEWYCGKLRCRSTDRTAITRHVNMEQLSCLRRRDKVFWFSTLLTFVSFVFAAIMYCFSIYYILIRSKALLPRPHFIATSWFSFNQLTFW